MRSQNAFYKIDADQELREFETMLEDPENRKQYELFNREYELKKALAEARRGQRLTQQELSEKTGLSQQAISRIENVNDMHGFTFPTLFRYLEGIGYELAIRRSS